MYESKPIVYSIGKKPMYGKIIPFLYLQIDEVLLEYIVFAIQDDSEKFPFKISASLVHNRSKAVTTELVLKEEIISVHLIRTDNNFRKKFKRTYDIIKLVTETKVITVGAYCDNENVMDANNSYLLCTYDFINLLADSETIVSSRQLNDTPFESFRAIFDQKELAKILLRE